MGHSGFAPIDRIHLAFHAYHAAAHDHNETVQSYHFCAGSGDEGVFQCLIYDSAEANAKLIGIEYLIPEEMFSTLDEDEKLLWHSHKHEVASGLLLPLAPSLSADKDDRGDGGGGGLRAADHETEKAHMSMIYKTYGKIVHTWHPPTQKLPLGPPTLMTSLGEEDSRQLCIAASGSESRSVVAQRDIRHNHDTLAAQKRRLAYLDLSYEPQPGADAWKVGKAVQFGLRPVHAKLSSGKVIKNEAAQ